MSDYDRWFIHKDGTPIKCKRERFSDCLKDLFGATKAAAMYKEFRRASFAENCRLELELLEE
jgi:hypothetical protein